MTLALPEIGKISPEVFDEIVYPRLGRDSKSVLVGPQHGVDVGVVEVAPGVVMAITCDPVFIVPQYGWKRAAWFATHILASDAATSGLRPTYMAIDLNLPLSIEAENLREIWETIHEESTKIGMSIVSGHTGKYTGCEYPMVGGATVMSLGPKDRYVTPTMAQVGDKIVLTKGAAIEAAGLFAVSFPDVIADKFGREFADRAQEIFWLMSVVEDAMAAVSVGTREHGVTAMHDATECGVYGGVFEVARASGTGVLLHKERIPVREDVRKICDLFHMDPYTSISEGTLVICCREEVVDRLVGVLAERSIEAAVIGEMLPQSEGIMIEEAGRRRVLEHPRVDPFWAAFAEAMEKYGS